MLGESRVKIDFLLWQTQLDWGYWSRFCPLRLLYQPTYPIAFNHQTPETRFGHKIQKLHRLQPHYDNSSSEDFLYFYSGITGHGDLLKNQVLQQWTVARMFFAHSSPSQHLETSQHLLNKKSSTFLKLTNMPPPPWWEDVGAGVRQGDLAAPDVQHLQHGLRVSGNCQSFFHQGEADDGEGHDRQGDGEDHTPEGKSWWGSCQRSLWRVARVRRTWECRPGFQAQWQGKERSAREGATRRSTPPASTTSAHNWQFVVDSVEEVVSGF